MKVLTKHTAKSLNSPQNTPVLWIYILKRKKKSLSV